MRRLFLILLFLTAQMLQATAQNGFRWDLNPYQAYPSYVNLHAESKGFIMGDDQVSVSARNLSNSNISFGVRFTFTDFCGKSTTEVWPGGLSLKSGETQSFPLLISTKCKELKKEGNSQTGIASVRAEIINFKNLTGAENKTKEDKPLTNTKIAAANPNDNAVKQQNKQEGATKTKEENPPSNTIGTVAKPNNSSVNQNKQEQLNKAIATANEQISQNRLANEARQKQTEQQVNAVVGGVAELATGIMANIASDKARTEEALKKIKERRKEYVARGNILLENFLPLATEGNEYAITQIIEAYAIIEMPAEYYDALRKDGFAIGHEPKNYVSFLIRSYENFKSSSAKKALIDHYTKVAVSFNNLAKEHRRKAIIQPILAGIFAAGGIIAGNELNKTVAESWPAYIQAAGVLGGGVLLISGLVHLVRIGDTNNDDVYIDANKKLNRIISDKSLTVLPTYDHQNRTFGIAMNLTF